MKGRAKVLDSRYLEFIEYLQKIGELQNMVRMIHRLSDLEPEDGEAIYARQDPEKGVDHMIYPFWQRGWIEIRETDRKGKHWQGKEYALKVCLEEIIGYFAQERLHRLTRSGYPLTRQNVQVLA